MSQTVIGFFNDLSDARRAVQQLQQGGISRDRIDVSDKQPGSSGDSAGTAGPQVNPVSGSARDENSVQRTSDDRTVDRAGRNTNVFTDFFNNLFGGSDGDEADRYSHVAARSGAMITVHVQSREEAERASSILDESGALDVEEQASLSGYSRRGSGDTSSDRSTAGHPLNLRSRIFDRRIDEQQRLRGSNWSDESGTGGPGRGLL